ncbi:MAG TPA: histidine phosphatase family protein [Actinomycetota bacterium]|nr:histidine phosphatase family protein [Actinomycetota bacterium]
MASRVFVVRHGRTAWNAGERFRGRSDLPLDERGLAEAARAAARLARERPAVLATSPLRRAVQTAEVIAAACGLEPVVHDGLTDLDHGAWTGLSPAEAEARDPEAFARFRAAPLEARPPGGEELRSVLARTRRALEEIMAEHPEAPIAVVSHEVPIRLLLGELLGICGEAIWRLDVPTGSVSVLEAEGGAPGRLRAMEIGALG